jgi:ABC-2 type transport system ATP-binding protein
MIEIKDVSKTYGKNKKAVDHLTWTVRDGSITGFIGPNGAGKSTTLHMITGVLNPDEGQILINGLDIQKQPLEAKKQFGFVPDEPDIFLRLTALEYLNFIGDIYGVSTEKRKKFIDETAPRFDMQNEMGHQILSFSHGMRQKVMVMGALIHEPSIWILDEPMVGLDPKAAFTVKEMMHEHAAKGYSVVFSTHVLEVAEKLCDQICMINHGMKIYDGTLEQLEEEHKGESLEDIFLAMTK